ncbi:MAG: DUF3108 domain-containing protein [Betaproteobacteria bacterium]|nr:DUF3108 domain-containing protein [Betaproteobacteria bacterium]
MPDINAMRKLAYFVAASLLAHLVGIYGVRLELPRRAAEPLPLEVQLQATVPPPRVLPRPRPRPPAMHQPSTAAVATEPIFAVPTPVAAEPMLEAPAQVAAAAVFEPAEPETPALAPPPLETSEPEPKPAPLLARRLPRQGEITYELYLGNDKFSVGRTLQTWELGDGGYRLSSVSETTGLVALFTRQRLAYESRGQLTASGLRPEHFTTHRVRSGRSENAAADLDWNAMTAMIVNPQRDVALHDDAQDLVSFIYQLGLLPLAPGRIELPITNGWKLERYELEIGGEEELQTPIGALRAVPIKQVRRPGQESIELWLAAEYQWLPVRIRFFDREGEPSGEQLVSEIRVSAD